ncbi:replication protein A 14 kDa subunit [Folsomia candida]|uniref:replication protein A 14 kDa subunit n=1 Tax=Folsomia candida TaxID=158441 RepID=UPI000B8F6254|nr:replication protein A 14 kDa subunit [Folsomia candida]
MNGDKVRSVHRARVNGAFLNQYHGKPVCLLGTVLRADGGGSAFQVRSSDGQTINIRLKTPISEPLQGLIEIYGTGQGRNLILADSFTIFPETLAATFDMNTYNETLVVLQQLNDYIWLPS